MRKDQPFDSAFLKKATKNTILISIILYATICGIQFAPEVNEVSVKAFGEYPMGIPVTAVVIIGFTLIYLPIPFVFYHGQLILLRSQQEGGRHPLGLFSMTRLLIKTAKTFPELKRSVYICIAGLVYFGIVCAVWIWYVDHLGI